VQDVGAVRRRLHPVVDEGGGGLLTECQVLACSLPAVPGGIQAIGKAWIARVCKHVIEATGGDQLFGVNPRRLAEPRIGPQCRQPGTGPFGIGKVHYLEREASRWWG
jgi:hypothetical protein